MNRRKRALAGHITSPRCESLPMVSGSTREHDAVHDHDAISRAADERSKRSARRHPRACGGRAHRRARLPRRRGTKWRRKLTRRRRAAWIPSRCAIRRRVAAVVSARNSTGRRWRFGRRCSRARRSLDEALADGASPLWSPELARRARQLVSRGSRQQLANSLERLVKEAQRSVSPRAVAVLLPRREISEAETSLFSIATRLRDERPMYARGTALLSQLLSDGSGPMHNARTGGSLGQAVGAIAAALDGRWRTRRSAGVGGRERERA